MISMPTMTLPNMKVKTTTIAVMAAGMTIVAHHVAVEVVEVAEGAEVAAAVEEDVAVAVVIHRESPKNILDRMAMITNSLR
eukprot:scaffold7616_cov50-Skeletonema_dohrnii-CCMP3373.AAC.1